MQRLSLAELKAQKNNVVANLEAIKGGNAGGCHCACEDAKKLQETQNAGGNPLVNAIVSLICIMSPC